METFRGVRRHQPTPSGRGAGRAVRAVAVGLALGAGVGCSTFSDATPSGDPFEPWDAEDGDVVVLDIDNRNTREARIYARWNGMRTRVGEVRPMDSAQLQAEYRHGNLRIEVDFIGGDGFISPPYAVSPGEVVRFRIPG